MTDTNNTANGYTPNMESNKSETHGHKWRDFENGVLVMGMMSFAVMTAGMATVTLKKLVLEMSMSKSVIMIQKRWWWRQP